ncbi:MAG: hypothetical protein V3U98_00945 [Acidobacteriota bacterium]
MSPLEDVYFIDADLPTAAKSDRRADQTPRPGAPLKQKRFLPGDTTVTRAGGRRPALAASLSLLLCGAGQLCNARRDLALLYFLTEMLVIAMNWCVWRLWEPLVDLLHVFFIKPTDIMFVVALVNYLFLVFVILNVAQAFREAAGGEEMEPLRQPLLSGPASLLVPGWGQFLNAQPLKAALLMGLFLTGAYAFALSVTFPSLWKIWDSSYQLIFGFELTNGGLVAFGSALIAYLFAFYDAWLVARRQRSEFI